MIGQYKESKRDEHGDLTVTFIVSDDTDIEKLEKVKDKILKISYEKFSGKKSERQNKYFWELITNLGNSLGLTKFNCYLMELSSWGVYTDISIPSEAEDGFREAVKDSYRHVEKLDDSFDGSVKLRCYKGLHLYSREETRYLLEHVVQDAKDQGIETIPPYLLKAMFEE